MQGLVRTQVRVVKEAGLEPPLQVLLVSGFREPRPRASFSVLHCLSTMAMEPVSPTAPKGWRMPSALRPAWKASAVELRSLVGDE